MVMPLLMFQVPCGLLTLHTNTTSIASRPAAVLELPGIMKIKSPLDTRLKIKEGILIYVKINIDSSQFHCMKQNFLKENKILFSVFHNLVYSLYFKLCSFDNIVLMTGNGLHDKRPDWKERAFHKPLTVCQLKVSKYVFTFNYDINAFVDTSCWKLLTTLSRLVGLTNQVSYLSSFKRNMSGFHSNTNNIMFDSIPPKCNGFLILYNYRNASHNFQKYWIWKREVWESSWRMEGSSCGISSADKYAYIYVYIFVPYVSCVWLHHCTELWILRWWDMRFLTDHLS